MLTHIEIPLIADVLCTNLARNLQVLDKICQYNPNYS